LSTTPHLFGSHRLTKYLSRDTNQRMAVQYNTPDYVRALRADATESRWVLDITRSYSWHASLYVSQYFVYWNVLKWCSLREA